MSLLPEQILPQTEPIGEVNGAPVTITKNWWLLIYNIAAQVLGGAASLPAPKAIPITPSVSPYAYTAPSDGDLAVTGGLVSSIVLTRYTDSVKIGVTTEIFPLRSGDIVTVTFGQAPTFTFFPN